jgi:alcohol dehydrogenase
VKDLMAAGKVRHFVPPVIALFRARSLPVDQLLTHRLKQEEINEGFDRLREVGVRQVMVFE